MISNDFIKEVRKKIDNGVCMCQNDIEYIRKDKIKFSQIEIEEGCHNDRWTEYYMVAFKKDIDAMEREEVRPLVRAKWRELQRAHYFKCTNCKTSIPYKFGYSGSERFYRFCPNCGAVMEK